MPPRTAILFVDDVRTRCGNCNQETLPAAIRHDDIAGWDRQPGRGCGALFTTTAAGHGSVTREDLHRIRPDLPIHGDHA